MKLIDADALMSEMRKCGIREWQEIWATGYVQTFIKNAPTASIDDGAYVSVQALKDNSPAGLSFDTDEQWYTYLHLLPKTNVEEVIYCGECKHFNDGDCTEVARLVGEHSFCDLGQII